MQRAVFLAGFSLYNGRLRDALSQCSIFHFNWYETPSGKLNFLKKLAVLSFLKRSGKKIVFTLHNKTNHLSENRTPERRKLQEQINAINKEYNEVNARIDELQSK